LLRISRVASAALGCLLAAQIAWLAAVPQPLPAGRAITAERIVMPTRPLADLPPVATLATEGHESASVRPTANVQIRVIGPGGDRIRGASVVASTVVSRQCALSDAEGLASLVTPADRPVALRITALGFEVSERTFTPAHASPEKLFETEVRLDRAAPLVGKLVDETGEGVANATVTFAPLSALDEAALAAGLPAAVKSDPDGTFMVLQAPRRGVVLRVEKAGFVTSEVVPGTEESLHVSMRRAAVIRGTVVDETGLPRVGIPIRLIDLDGLVGAEPVGPPVLTGPEGEFVLEGAPAGKRLVVRALLSGSPAVESAPLSAQVGESAHVPLTIPAAARPAAGSDRPARGAFDGRGR